MSHEYYMTQREIELALGDLQESVDMILEILEEVSKALNMRRKKRNRR